MREENYPEPVSDPESDGIPQYADDDSTAYDDVESGRQADGPSPAQLPADQPLAVDRYGVTPEEARLGESLDLKVGREVPDPALATDSAFATDPALARADARQSPISAEAYDPEPAGVELDRLSADTALVEDGEPIDPRTDSPVSMYDRPLGDDDIRPVGRIVEPDQGGPVDSEKAAIGYDAGSAGGGASAEELAMHEVPE